MTLAVVTKIKMDGKKFTISIRCILVTNVFGRSATACCACELIKLSSIAFCWVRIVHKFDFRLIINCTPTVECDTVIKHLHVF